MTASPSLKTLFSLQGRVAAITGGAGLLGRQHAEALAESGATIVILDMDLNRAKEAAAALESTYQRPMSAVQVDVSDPASVTAAFGHIATRLKRLDILINNAALTVKGGSKDRASYFAPFEEYPAQLWDKALRVNLTGLFLCSQAAGRLMKSQNSGVQINISSTYGLVSPDQRIYQGVQNTYGGTDSFNTPISYATTKAAVLNFTRYLATYWGAAGIRVNALVPGGVYENHDETFVKNYTARVPMGRMAKPWDYKGAIAFLASDASAYMTGATLVVDGGWTAW